ncbi:leucine-rich repeat and guanylate kinase domain-containing protein-like [Haliotis rufescens]|uniref:leucine-rich repeat and guanylate kinase domain-containing protein-like n=1 Tax=Haliotis rufescens TaxID=6454 RepID=UPI00201E78AD|nr:leucine-rich repeat and guanylate kinase domain-containing protein-like [Haliotis rufescens]
MADLADNIPDAEYYSNVDGEYVVVNGESHLINTDTDILKLDDNPDQLDEPLGDEMDDNIGVGPAGTDDEDDVELSPDGILDEETVGRGLSNLGRSAEGAYQVYLHCTVPGFNLTDISILAEYVHLQKVEIPYNEITDLSPLSNLEHLLILDASHNQIPRVLDFTPPKNLMLVDLSFNQIEEMNDLSAHHFLKKLNLDNNKIHELKGLNNCKRLSFLSMAHNKIENLQGLEGLPIQHLNMCHNSLTRIENIESLTYLRHLNLSGNKIRSLSGLEGHDMLEYIDLENNEVIDISEMKYLMKLRMLRQLNLLQNPVQELPDYRLSILFRLQSLTDLDRMRVEVEEKVAARNMFDPPPEVVAAGDHMMHVVYNFLQPSRVWDSTLPNIETVYPMLVLVGPQGSGKKDLALKLTEEFSDYFGYGMPDTTRKPYADEVHEKDYNFVSIEKFEIDIKMGQFIQSNEYHGDWYGLQMESVEGVAREGLACVVQMELEGVLSLKNTYFEPRYVLILPLNHEAHERRLRERGVYSEQQIKDTLKRAEMYKDYNQEHPGFFDMLINSDDIQDGYRRLRHLVMDYLGIGSMSPNMMTDPTNNYEEAHGETDMYPLPGAASATMMGARTWSKPSLPDSMSQTRGKVTSPATTGRGIVEEESLRRRHSAAKGVVAGYVPPLYEQLLTGYPKTAPQAVDDQVGLGDEMDPRAFSAPVNTINVGNSGALPPASPDSSTDDASSGSGFSDLDSATELQRGSTPPSQNDAAKGLLPTETVNPLELISEQGYKSASNTELPAPRPPSAPRPDSRNRPGSDRHKILPPINQTQTVPVS